MTMRRHGGLILAGQLACHQVERVFTVPGESFLPVLDGFLDTDIEVITCRHEGGAAFMAEATGKLTAQPGIAFVSRAPGATNAAAGLHVAMHDSTPMILFVGQIERRHRNRDAFQEVNLCSMFAPLAKWCAEIDDVARIPEYVARAFRVALTGRPGPVVLSLPEDMLYDISTVEDRRPSATPQPAIAESDLRAVVAALECATHPLIILGGSLWSTCAAAALERFVERWHIPVVAGFRRQDMFDNRHYHYAGDLSPGMNDELAARLGETDLLLALGTRLGDVTTGGYSLLDPDLCQVIHVHPDPGEPGRVWPTAIAITASPETFVLSLPVGPARRHPMDAADVALCRNIYEDWVLPSELPGEVQLAEICRWLSDHLPESTVMTNGAGNYAAFLHRHFQYKRYRTQLAPTSGSMGYGLPAAIAATLHDRFAPAICMAGDGCFQMTMNEFVTACSIDAPVIVIIANNGLYGTIRMHQEKQFPGRASGTQLSNPDFAAFARACGGHGETVNKTEDFPDAFTRAMESGRPSIIELMLDSDAITTTSSFAAIRGQS